MGTRPMIGMHEVGFTYAGSACAVLTGLSLEVPRGAFALLTGPTGSGKSTLLRLLKPEVRPEGELTGDVRVDAQRIGFVFQDPDNQIVCDEVWHEMAFGLENEGVPEPEMRLRVAETCYFLGIEPWFRKKTAELSGGQRQVLALAATLAMRPELLLLDEPTAMLDPIAEKGFLALLFRANRELGITVVVATHRPWAMEDYASMRIRIGGDLEPGRPDRWTLRADKSSAGVRSVAGTHGSEGHREALAAVRITDAWFRYGRAEPWVLRAANLALQKGEARALVGGNGSGKSTLLGLVAQTLRPQRGRIGNACAQNQAFLPQNPKALLSYETVGKELMAWSGGQGYTDEDALQLLGRLGIVSPRLLWDRHPYDLSGGQQQLLAVAKLLLARPGLLMLDEPTKGLDDRACASMADALAAAQRAGCTVLLATHDLEFARAVCNNVSLLFDGQLTCTMPASEFFASAQFFCGGVRDA